LKNETLYLDAEHAECPPPNFTPQLGRLVYISSVSIKFFKPYFLTPVSKMKAMWILR